MSYCQQIYNALRQHGLSEAGALGVLGNWDCESNCEPYRVQGDFSSYRSISKAYVRAIEDGQLPKQQFANDGKGFGLAQWTYPTRKAELYDMAKQTGLPIDSVELQVDFAVREMKRDYPSLFRFLCDTLSVYDACYRVCTEFERPAVNNVDARWQAACRIKQEIDLDDWESSISQAEIPSNSGASDTHSGAEEAPSQVKIETWPPRTIDAHCSGWAEVWLLQAILKCRGYNVLVDGIWGQVLTDKVKAFQQANGLDADGVVGRMTWKKLLEMG